MTYEEALNRLLQVAGDYKATYNARAINEALARREVEQIHKEAKKLVEGLSPSPSFLSITLDPSGHLIISSSYETTTTYNSIYNIQGKDKEEAARSYFEKSFFIFLRNCVRLDRITLEDLTRVNSYVSLIYRSLTSELLETFTSIIQKRRDKQVEEDKDMRNFADYRTSVRAAMSDMAVCWLREVEIVPGMKLIIRNLKTGTCEDRTVKKVGYSNGVRVLSFKESSSVVRGDERIVSVGSWLANNPEYSGLAKIYY